jgi:peptide/nickel transport system permease protein
VERYVFKRLRRGLITLWLTTLVVFMLLRITGNPVDFLATPGMSQADIESIKEAYGFNKPIYVQYLIFLKSVGTGDFGKSMRWRSGMRSRCT